MLLVLLGSLFSCYKQGLKNEDVIHFDSSVSIKATGMSDLDRNGNPEIAIAVTSFLKDEFKGDLPVSTSIFVYEKKKNKFRYIWKSSPLTILDKWKTPIAQEILSIKSSEREDDPSLHISGTEQDYRLYFSDNYYHLVNADKREEIEIPDMDVLDFLGYEADSIHYHAGSKEEYFLVTRNIIEKTEVTIYKIKASRKKPLVPYMHWTSPLLESITIVSGSPRDYVIESEAGGTVRIRSLKKL